MSENEPVRIGSVSVFWVQGEKKKPVSSGITVERLTWKFREEEDWPYGRIRMRVNSSAAEIMEAMPDVELQLRWGVMTLKDNPFKNKPLADVLMNKIILVEFRGRSESKSSQASRVDVVEFVIEATCDIHWRWMESVTE